MSQTSTDLLSPDKITQHEPQYKLKAQASGLNERQGASRRLRRSKEAPSTETPPNKAQLIRELQQNIRRTETARRNDDGTIVSSGSPAIDAILPAGGYHRGTIVEWISDTGSGAEFISLTTARQAALEGGALVIIDPTGKFYPPAAAALGINLGNLILLRDTHQPSSPAIDADDYLWSIDQALRCPAIAAVWGHMPEFADSFTRERWLRRFQLSAESSGCLGLFLHPRDQSGKPSWSEVQWVTKCSERSVQCSETGVKNCRRIELELVRCRGAVVGQRIVLDVNTISGNISESINHETSQNKTIAASAINNTTDSPKDNAIDNAKDNDSRNCRSGRKRKLRRSRALSVAGQLADSAAGRRAARA